MGNKGCMKTASRPRLSGKVSTDRLTKGASVSRHGRMVLTCVRTLAPIASQARHFPPYSGEADTKEERNYSFLKCIT